MEILNRFGNFEFILNGFCGSSNPKHTVSLSQAILRLQEIEKKMKEGKLKCNTTKTLDHNILTNTRSTSSFPHISSRAVTSERGERRIVICTHCVLITHILLTIVYICNCKAREILYASRKRKGNHGSNYTIISGLRHGLPVHGASGYILIQGIFNGSWTLYIETVSYIFSNAFKI